MKTPTEYTEPTACINPNIKIVQNFPDAPVLVSCPLEL